MLQLASCIAAQAPAGLYFELRDVGWVYVETILTKLLGSILATPLLMTLILHDTWVQLLQKFSNGGIKNKYVGKYSQRYISL